MGARGGGSAALGLAGGAEAGGGAGQGSHAAPGAGGLRRQAAATPRGRVQGTTMAKTLRSGRPLHAFALPAGPCPFLSPGVFCGGEKGIWGSGRRTMLSRLLCAAPSPEGKKPALQRPGRRSSVVLPLLLLVVLTACRGRPSAGPVAGGRGQLAKG